MFNELIGFVKTPQFVIDAVNLSLAFHDSIEDEGGIANNFSESLEDIFLFNADMMAEMSSI